MPGGRVGGSAEGHVTRQVDRLLNPRLLDVLASAAAAIFLCSLTLYAFRSEKWFPPYHNSRLQLANLGLRLDPDGTIFLNGTPALAFGNVIANVDSALVSPRHGELLFRVAGWAVDPSTFNELQIVLLADGQPFAAGLTNGHRPDVQEVYRAPTDVQPRGSLSGASRFTALTPALFCPATGCKYFSSGL